MYRQGDLILQRIDARDTGPQSRQTLAVGEESGHSHVLQGFVPEPGIIVLDDVADLHVDGMPWRHDAIKIPAGTYRYWVQREYTPEAIRDVRD